MKKDHEFLFKANAIARAASAEAKYHREREQYWRTEYDAATKTVRATASIEVREYDVTGGKRTDLVINYGDPGAYGRMQEAFVKIQSHVKAAEQYESDARVYGTQDEFPYHLSSEDVHYFRMGGETREA